MKFGYELFGKPNIPTLKPTEMDLLIHLVENQDNSTGEVLGVHYKDISAGTGMVKQSFYSAMQSLKDKKIITYERHQDGAYYTVTVLDNAFPDKQSLSKGYIDLQKKVFHSKEFKSLKAQEKYLVLYFCKRTHENQGSFCIYVKNLYKNLTKLLGVTERVVRSYLHSLKKFFSIGIKSGKYYITYKHSVFKEKIEAPERLVRDKRVINEIVHKLKIRNTNDHEITQTAEFLYQYKEIANKHKKDLKKAIFDVIKGIVSGTLQKERKLQFKLINKLLKERLENETMEESHNIPEESDFVKEFERKQTEKIKLRLGLV